MKTQNTIVAATGNQHKLKEFRAILKGWNILSAEEAGFFGEVEETGKTFAENAEIKALAVMRATGYPALADDSGLCVDALHGAPGVYSARYAGQHGGDEQSAKNRAFLLQNLQGVKGRSAHFTSAIVLAFPDGRKVVAEGYTYGHILEEERGANGFGYDALFFSDELQKSFGEASEEEKNAVSHRGRALAILVQHL